MPMNNLVAIQEKQAVTTSLVVAEGCQLTHRTVIRLVRKYRYDFEEFGTLNFESSKSGGRDTEYAILNEDQATYLITLFRNTGIVRRFKIELVKAFRRITNQLAKLQKADPEFRYVRDDSKVSQRHLTDAIKSSRDEAGKETRAYHFSNEMLMVNEVFCGKRQPIDRDGLAPEQLNRLAMILHEDEVLIHKGEQYAERKRILMERHQLLLPPGQAGELP